MRFTFWEQLHLHFLPDDTRRPLTYSARGERLYSHKTKNWVRLEHPAPLTESLKGRHRK